MNTPNSIEVSTMSAQFAPSPVDKRSSDPMECIEENFQKRSICHFSTDEPGRKQCAGEFRARDAPHQTVTKKERGAQISGCFGEEFLTYQSQNIV